MQLVGFLTVCLLPAGIVGFCEVKKQRGVQQIETSHEILPSIVTQSVTTFLSFCFSLFTLVRSSLQKCKNLFFIDHHTAILSTAALNLFWIKRFFNIVMKRTYKLFRMNYQQCLYDFFMNILNALPVQIPKTFRYCAINPTLMVSQMPLKYSAYHPHFLRDTLYFFHPACIQSSNLPMVRSGKYNNYSCYPPDVP